MPPDIVTDPVIRLIVTNRIIQSIRERIQVIDDLINDNSHYKFIEPDMFKQFIDNHASLISTLETAMKAAESIRAEFQLRL
jgi:hypothetical protein